MSIEFAHISFQGDVNKSLPTIKIKNSYYAIHTTCIQQSCVSFVTKIAEAKNLDKVWKNRVISFEDLTYSEKEAVEALLSFYKDTIADTEDLVIPNVLIPDTRLS